MRFTLIITTLLLGLQTLFALELNKPLPNVTLENEDGALVTGQAFHSSDLNGKVQIIFYVDPDEKDLNEDLSQKLKAEKFDKTKVGSVAIINLAATWKPNFVIEQILKSKQKEFPDTLYVKDRVKKLVKEWNVSDDNSDIIVINQTGKVLYFHEGRVPDTQEVIDIIKENM